MTETMWFFAIGYFLPLLITGAAFRLSIHFKKIDRDGANVILTVMPVVNIVIAIMFVISIMLTILDLTVNGPEKQ